MRPLILAAAALSALAVTTALALGITDDPLVWRTAASMNTARQSHGSAFVNGVLYVVGGGTYGQGTTVEAYDPASDTWTYLAPLPESVGGHAVASLGGKVYMFGGMPPGGWTYRKNTLVYDPVANQWASLAPLSIGRTGAVAVTLGDRIFVMGGAVRDYGIMTATVEVYNPATNSWTTAASMNKARAGCVAGVLSGEIYVAGGAPAAESFDASVEIYNPTTNAWRSGPSLPAVMASAAGGAVGNSLWVVGGTNGSYSWNVESYRFDLSSGQWTVGPRMPSTTKRHGASCAGFQGELYFTGGCNPQNVSLFGLEILGRSNANPVADAGSDVVVEGTSPTATAVSLDGRGSGDPDGDALTLSWSAPAGSGVVFNDAASPTPTGLFPVGSVLVTLVVADGSGGTDADEVLVTVRDTTAPSLSVPQDKTVECTGTSGQAVSLGTATASDACGSVTVTSDAPALYYLGSTTVTWTATDSHGLETIRTQNVTVRDTTAPVLSVSGVPGELWPPNHKMVRITPTVTVSDAGDPAPKVTVAVTSNEPDNGLGDGDKAGDIVIHSPTDIELRAERSGNGSGRIYMLTWTATDSSGNSSSVTLTVKVPKEKEDMDGDDGDGKEKERKDGDEEEKSGKCGKD